MEINRARLLKAYPPVPKEVKDEISLTLRAIESHTLPASKHYAKRLPLAGVLAAVLIFVMLTVALATGARYGIFDFLDRILGESSVLPRASELVQTSLGTLDLPNTLITAEEAVYDGGNLQVVYSIEAKNLSRKPTEADLDNPLLGIHNPNSELSKALAADKVYYYGGFDSFFVNGEAHSMTNGSFGDSVFDEESGKIYCYMNIQLASSAIIPQGDFSVGLPVAGETWRDKKLLEFTIKETALQGQKTMLETTYETVTVQSLFTSPMRIYVNLRVETKAGTPPEAAEKALLAWQYAVLADANGIELSVPLEMTLDNFENGSACDYHYIFPPADSGDVYLAPLILGNTENWVPDMGKALRVK